MNVATHTRQLLRRLHAKCGERLRARLASTDQDAAIRRLHQHCAVWHCGRRHAKRRTIEIDYR